MISRPASPCRKNAGLGLSTEYSSGLCVSMNLGATVRSGESGAVDDASSFGRFEALPWESCCPPVEKRGRGRAASSGWGRDPSSPTEPWFLTLVVSFVFAWLRGGPLRNLYGEGFCDGVRGRPSGAEQHLPADRNSEAVPLHEK